MSPTRTSPSPSIADAARRARKLLHRRALMGGAASAVPIPGLDWAADAALVSHLFPRISAEFGLSAEQIDQLEPSRREQVEKAVASVGSVVIGKLISKELIMRLMRRVAVRVATKRVSKFIPLAGQLAAGAIGYATIRYLGEQHIRDCIRVLEITHMDAPAGAEEERRPRLRFPSPLQR